MEDRIFYTQLVDRYMSKTATEEELMVFFHLLNEGKLKEHLGQAFMANVSIQETSDIPQTTINKPKYIVLKRIAVAATIIGLIGLVVFFRNTNTIRNDQLAVKPIIHNEEILPGGNKAILTLSNGLSITLDSIKAGEIAKEGSTSIIKNDSGFITYKSKNAIDNSTAYNILTTPRGGQYEVKLPDGSLVWLNAASRLSFPASFNNNERLLELEGEAYFEVVHKSSAPFRIQLKSGEKIDVLGTSFNIHCYTGEPVKTTLLQGSVKVESKDHTAVLKPGQEAVVKNNGSLNITQKENAEQSVAWKDGLFEFNKADITTIMNEIERWYNVDVFYLGEKSKKQFVGKIPRSSSLAQVRTILELSDIHFTVEGRKVFVLPGK